MYLNVVKKIDSFSQRLRIQVEEEIIATYQNHVKLYAESQYD